VPDPAPSKPKAGLPHLPYLEDMPDEIEVDWDT
jgi:hypothetical protein